MKRLFRSRLPPSLEPSQLSKLARQSHLPEEDIEEWYERFNHCYPHGRLSYKEFIMYLKQLQTQNGNDHNPKKSMVKQLFLLLDLDKDKQLNFEEFFLFNILINQGSIEDKLKLILSLYDKDKKKYLTRQQLENVLRNMFDILDIHEPKTGLSKKIDTILTRANFNNQDSKISWHTFSSHVLNDPSLFKLLISNDINGNDSDDNWSYLITRF
jgi:Ca2+-binding EF-hand superfamily protein